MKIRSIYCTLFTTALGLSSISLADTPSTEEAKPASRPDEEKAVKLVSPGRVTSFSNENDVYKLETENGIKLEIRFLAEDVFHLLAAPVGKYDDPKNDPEKAQIVIKEEKLIKTELEKSDEFIVIKTAKAKLTINMADSMMKLEDAAGKVLFEESSPLTFSEKNTTQTLKSSEAERFYGGGQQNGYFAHKGTKIDIEADGNWDEGGKPSPAPYYLSTAGYGVLRDTFSTGEYDFRSDTAVMLSQNENRFDAYYFVGDMKQVVNLYTELTGRPNFVPIWGLELGEADAYMTRDKETKELVKNEDGSYVETTPDCVPRLAEKYREHDMPGGWILPNDGYGCGYVELPETVEKLKDLGFYTGLWTESDLTQTDWEVGEAGIRVQKLDVAWTGPAYQFSLDANKKAWTSLTTNSDSRGFVWTVQGWAGTQRYGVCWTGDQYGSWDLIRYHIPTLIGSGLSGQAYATTDVDGIFGGSPETYTRDLQWKCFTPVLYAMNGWAGISKSPWAYEEPYRSINRNYLKLKMRMTPYMYKYTREAYDTGAPIVRGMLWDFPEDPKTWGRDTEYQYMLGESILVAPVYTSMKVNQGYRKEDIYLPKGTWFDYSDGRRVPGETTIDAYPVTLEKLPVFIRGGAIIPMYPEMLYNNEKPKDPLTFDIYPHGESEFELYEDDGLTRKYQNGESSRQLITSKAPEDKAGNISITIGKAVGDYDKKPKDRIYQLQVHSEIKPESVSLGDEKLQEIANLSDYEAAKTGWYFAADERQGTVHVRLERASTDQEYVVNLEIDELAKLREIEPYPIPVERPDLDVTEFIVKASSSSNSSPVGNAFDGTPETMWHSDYSKETPGKYPYTVDIDLNGLYAVKGINYLARKDGGNGLVKDYEVYVSRSASAMGKRVAKGSFEKHNTLQTVNFPVQWGEHVKLVFLNDHMGTTHAAAAELGVLRSLDAAPLKEEIAYLSDLKPESTKGDVKMDSSVGGKPITVNEQEYKKGIGALSGSEIIYKLDGSWDKLSGNVGMDDEVGDAGSVMFRVYADGKVVFESPEQTGKSIKQLMELDIKGVKELKLVLLPLDDGSENDHGDWVDVKLIKKGSE